MTTVDLKAYWEQVSRFSQYPEDKRADGYALGLLAEAGEACGVVDKWLRNKYDEAEMKRRLVDELGDCAWFCAACLSLTDMLEDGFEVYTDGGFDAYALLAWGLRDFSQFVYMLQREVYVEGGDELYWARKAMSSIASMATYADTTLQAVLDANVAKLTARHG